NAASDNFVRLGSTRPRRLPRRGPLSMHQRRSAKDRTARFRFARTRVGAVRAVNARDWMWPSDADDQPADPQAAGGAEEPQQGAGAAVLAAKARGLHPRLHDDAEKAELRAAQGRQGAADQRLRGDRLYPG